MGRAVQSTIVGTADILLSALIVDTLVLVFVAVTAASITGVTGSAGTVAEKRITAGATGHSACAGTVAENGPICVKRENQGSIPR